MQLDIYRRPDLDGKFSYLVVSAGQMIPEEATNTDWLVVEKGNEVDDNASDLSEYGIERLAQQLSEKGYAVTSVGNSVAQ